MKKNNRSQTMLRAAAVAILLLGVSCQDLLDLQPQTALSDATAFATPERIALAVTGVYDAAQTGPYGTPTGASRGYPFGAAHVEQGDARGEDVFNTQAFYLITYHSTYTPVTANNDWHFQTLFRLVNRINVVLAGLDGATPQGTMTQAVIDGYKGECRFLRALAYHELLLHFSRPYSDNPNAALGGMPIRTTPITGSSSAAVGVQTGRSTVAETYAFVLSDLNYAESVLPATRTGGLRITRAISAAAIALKTRVYLHMGDWANVITEGNKLASQASAPFSYAAAGISLPTDPYAAFSSGGSKSNLESIFSIENSAIDHGGVNGALPTMYASTASTPNAGRALVAISPLIWNEAWFLASDTRKSATFVEFGEAASGTGGKGGYFTKKYTDVANNSDNAPVIRYAEVLLNMAEAIQRQAGGTVSDRAFQMYNAVRSRSVADPATNEITDFATGTDLIRAILNERRIEFLMEGLRWGDIHRLAQDATFNTWGGGIPAKVSSNLANVRALYTGDPATNAAIMANAAQRWAALPYSSKEFVWPFPLSEVNVNPTLAQQQNPGW